MLSDRPAAPLISQSQRTWARTVCVLPGFRFLPLNSASHEDQAVRKQARSASDGATIGQFYPCGHATPKMTLAHLNDTD